MEVLLPRTAESGRSRERPVHEFSIIRCCGSRDDTEHRRICFGRQGIVKKGVGQRAAEGVALQLREGIGSQCHDLRRGMSKVFANREGFGIVLL